MVIDASALIVLLQEEAEAPLFRKLIAAESLCLVSAATQFEASMVALARRGERGVMELQAIFASASAEIVPVTADHARRALDAFRRFGKGRHPAGLNFGDCLSYALAQATGEALLFKGDDFSRTDIERAA